MDQELQARLVKSLDWLESALKSGGEFAAEQAPQVVQELIVYSYAVNLALLVGSIALAVVLVFVFRWGRSIYRGAGRNMDAEFGGQLLMVFSLMLQAFPIAGIACSIHDLILIRFAPKLFVLQSLAELLK